MTTEVPIQQAERSTDRATRPRKRWIAVSTVVVAVLAAAIGCASEPSQPPVSSAPPPTTSTSSTAAPAETSGPGAGESETAESTTAGSASTAVRVTVGTQTYEAELYDNPTARDLARQLPLTLRMNDLNQLEKTGRLPRALTTGGVPSGSDPDVGEIGYYAPGQDLVLYYGDVGYYNGIITVGRFSRSIETIADQPDGVSVTVEAT